MRPKSIATVVSTLFSMPSRLSVEALTVVSSSSVRSGLISLTAPTRVVLPTPNPPATRILSVTGSTGGLPRSERPKIIGLFSCCLFGSVGGRPWPPPPEVCSERPEAVDHVAQNVLVHQLGRRYGTRHMDQFLIHEVPDEDPHHADGEIEFGGE